MTGVDVVEGRVTAVRTETETIACSAVIATPALPILTRIFKGAFDPAYLERLGRIEYLANICMVLELDRPLSKTYWLNVNDASFPFVGIIEHTNFEEASTYGGRHVVYLSKYLPADTELYQLTDEGFLKFSVPYIKQMFPQFDESWILKYSVWRADYAQPMVGLHYSSLIPEPRTPVKGAYIATMAQVYPNDRGTSFAVRQGRQIAEMVAADLGAPMG